MGTYNIGEIERREDDRIVCIHVLSQQLVETLQFRIPRITPVETERRQSVLNPDTERTLLRRKARQ